MHEKKLFLAPGLEITLIDAQQLALTLYSRRFTMKDESGLIRKLLNKAKNGGLIEAQFISEYESLFPREAIISIFKSLKEALFLIDRDITSPVDSTNEFLSHKIRGVNSVDGAGIFGEKSNELKILVLGEGWLANDFTKALVRNEISFSYQRNYAAIAEIENPSILIVACADNEDHIFFREVNRRAIVAKVPSIYVSLDTQVVRCGPTVIPNQNACYECYFHRLNSTRLFPREFEATTDSKNSIAHALPNQLSIEWAIAIALTQIFSCIFGLDLDLHLSPMREIDILKGNILKSNLLKLPRCPVCGSGNSNRPFSPVINSNSELSRA